MTKKVEWKKHRYIMKEGGNYEGRTRTVKEGGRGNYSVVRMDEWRMKGITEVKDAWMEGRKEEGRKEGKEGRKEGRKEEKNDDGWLEGMKGRKGQ